MNKAPIHYSSFPGYTKYEVRTPSVRPRSRLRLNDEDFFVGELRGEGGFAKVYSATWENGEEPDCVLKVQRPSNDWEWYILTQLGERLEQSGNLELRDNYMMANRCYTYTDGSIIVSRLQPQGSLLNLINTVHTRDKSVCESLALHLTAQILDLIHTLHTLDFIHADLKPDNFLVRDLPDFHNNSIQLIDFGKAIDLRTIPANIVFEDLVSTSGLKCVEMREKRPWRHHIDYFGVAATSYCLLFGQYMKVTKRDGRWQPKGTFKRGWQIQFWRKFFDTLLNLEGAEQKCLPSLQRLAASCREVLHRDLDLSQGVSKARDLLQRNLTKRRRTI